MRSKLETSATESSENKTMMKFSSYENEARPGVVITGVMFFYLQEVKPSILDIVVKFDHPFNRTRITTSVNSNPWSGVCNSGSASSSNGKNYIILLFSECPKFIHS